MRFKRKNSEHELRTIIKLIELKLFCENELKVCKSLYFSSALKEGAFHSKWEEALHSS